MQYSESPWLPQFLEYQSHFFHWDAYIQSWKLDQPPLEQMLCNFYHSDFCPFTHKKKTTIYTFSVLTTYNQILYQTQLKNKIWVKIAKQSPHNRDRYIPACLQPNVKHYQMIWSCLLYFFCKPKQL